MKRKVIEAFDYAADGVRASRLKAGRSYDFPADHAERFEREGKLEPIGSAVPVVAPASALVEDFASATPIVVDEQAATDLCEPARGRPKRK